MTEANAPASVHPSDVGHDGAPANRVPNSLDPATDGERTSGLPLEAEVKSAVTELVRTVHEQNPGL